MPSEKDPITNAKAPDLDVVRRFMIDGLARGAVMAVITAVIALLSRMRDLNTELMARLANKSRKRPPSETRHRLQLELPLLMQPVVNDGAPPANDGGTPAKPAKKKRGPKKRHLHGRPNLEHLPRVPELHAVTHEQRFCPKCGVEAATIGFKTTLKLDIEPARFVAREIKRETCACVSARPSPRSLA